MAGGRGSGTGAGTETGDREKVRRYFRRPLASPKVSAYLFALSSALLFPLSAYFAGVPFRRWSPKVSAYLFEVSAYLFAFLVWRGGVLWIWAGSGLSFGIAVMPLVIFFVTGLTALTLPLKPQPHAGGAAGVFEIVGAAFVE